MDSSWEGGTWTRYESAIAESIQSSFTSTSLPRMFLYAVLFAVGAYFAIQRLDYYPLLPLQELLWNAFVYILPPSLVMALDTEQSKAQTDMLNQSGYSTARTFAAKSEAVRRILRINGPVASMGFGRPRAFSGIGSLLKGPSTLPIAGLGNWDNSCYQNSIIQGLASLPSVASFLRHNDVNQIRDDASASTRAALSDIIRQLNDPENAGKRLWTPAALKSMSSWQQQDAQEYYAKILDDVEKDIASSVEDTRTYEGLRMAKVLFAGNTRQTSAQTTKSHAESNSQTGMQSVERSDDAERNETFNPLEGLLAQRVGCLQCGYVEGFSMVPFNCLTLPLARTYTSSIEDCLDNFTQLEKIDGVECGKCTLLRQEQHLSEFLQKDRASGLEALFADAERRLKAVQHSLAENDFSENTIAKKCQVSGRQRVSSTKTKQAVVVRGPESLVLHINRSVFDEMTGMLSKNSSRVDFPPILDLNCWSMENGQGPVEEWNVDPHVSLLAGKFDNAMRTSTPVSTRKYVLRAIITHYGRHENGHYICYRRDPGTFDKWWRLSDDDVSSVSQDDVLAQGGVFMLFYTRLQELGRPQARKAPTTIEQQPTGHAQSPLIRVNGSVPATLSSSASDDFQKPLEASLPASAKQKTEDEATEKPLALDIHEEMTASESLNDSKDLQSADFRKLNPIVPAMRTASITKKRNRKGNRPGTGSGMSNMVAAN